MERIICAAGLRHSDTIFYKSVIPLAYADDVDIIGRSICEEVSKFAEEARSIGLAVNESKTKYLLSATAKDASIGESVEIDGYNFEVLKDFVYLASSINTDTTSVWKSNVALLLQIHVTLG